MENTIRKIIAFILALVMSFSLISYTESGEITASAASLKSVSFKKRPTVKASKIKTTSVKLNWSKSKGATSYRVYRSTDGKKWKLVGKTKKTSLTVKKLKSNKKYYFRVKAYKSIGKKLKKSPYSKKITVRTKKKTKATTSYYYREDGQKMYVDENGIARPVHDVVSAPGGVVTRPSHCSYCGKPSNDCARSTSSYYCKACKRTIKAGECHSNSHFEKYF